LGGIPTVALTADHHPGSAGVSPARSGPRDFTASDLDRLWVGDQSYLRCWEGVVYFAFIVDVFSRRIVGWQLASHMRTDLVLDALKMALRCQNKLTGQQQETYKPSLRGTRSSSLLSPADCGSLLHAVRGR
jgi:transposase InsO family protein